MYEMIEERKNHKNAEEKHDLFHSLLAANEDISDSSDEIKLSNSELVGMSSFLRLGKMGQLIISP